jgi:hypothetical protein
MPEKRDSPLRWMETAQTDIQWKSRFVLSNPTVYLTKVKLLLLLWVAFANHTPCHSFRTTVVPRAAEWSSCSSSALWTQSILPTTASNTSTSTRLALTTDSPKAPTQERAVRFYFDIAVADEPLGRLTFCVPRPDTVFPTHVQNILQLVTQARRSIDPRCSYVGCEFLWTFPFVEGRAQYRWAHVLAGKGRNAVGPATERLGNPDAPQRPAHPLYGGMYYGLAYDELIPGYGENAVLLTVPLTGPGRGSTTLSMVRVAESPLEWRERLLLNSAVLGWLEPSSGDVFRYMAQQTKGPPKVTASGVLP